jgi:hypothetical protein
MEISENLKWSLQALACCSFEQKRLFPDYVKLPDELALVWGQVFDQQINLEEMPNSLSKSLRELDDFILSICGEEDQQFWTEEALDSSLAWAKIRLLAKNAIVEAGWKVEVPTVNDSQVYIHNPK